MLSEYLDVLERVGLIQPMLDERDTFSFRHGLVQDSAYESMLRNDRRALHRMTAQVLEKAAPEQPDQIAPLLAYHYDEADDDDKALEFAMRAGDAASRVFANTEALAHYSHAIQLEIQLNLRAPETYCARGRIYDRSGNFDAALTDFEQALDVARVRGDARTQWESLLEIGVLWSSRDYEFAGIFYQRALAQAKEIGDPKLIAKSLNRVGNWYINTERPQEALEHHRRALDIAQQLKDAPLLAETYDLLGTSMIIVGDTRRSEQYYQRALEIFRALDDRVGLVSTQSLFGFLHRNYDSDLIVVHHTFDQSITYLQQALDWARDINWRAGESFSMSQLAISYASQGEYNRALELARQALVIAESIQHHQWTVSALYTVAVIHADLLDAVYAQTQFERALELAQATRSGYWTRLISAWLAVTHVSQREWEQAHAVLERDLQPETPMRTLSQRRLWSARVLLALSQREAAVALDLTERLIATAVDSGSDGVMPLLWYLQARSLVQLHQHERAQEIALAGLARATVENVRPLIWRLTAVLAAARHGQGETEQAEQQRLAARKLAEELANGIPLQITDAASQPRPLREPFLMRVYERIERLMGEGA